jgi:dynein heavy chain
MKRELSELKPQLVLASSKTQDMFREIEEETVKVEAASAQVRSDEKVANLQAAAAQELKRDCEAELAQAIPILEGNVQETLPVFLLLFSISRWLRFK